MIGKQSQCYKLNKINKTRQINIKNGTNIRHQTQNQNAY